ncbi:MAG TPA: TIGR00153 family protein [Gammaproteobacteria bacterium]|jgi:predicted phosphate transport protein (TIGR00153 family)|nr:TIGR00153 family protein [Gammaproteobacteria bacterium]
MPKTYFTGIFGRSPIKPLQQHMEKVLACVRELKPFAESVLAADWPRAAELREKIIHLEHEADAMKRELRLHLPHSLFMPVARADLLGLLQVQDSIANKVKDITGLMAGRRMVLPEVLHEPFLRHVQRGIDATEQAYRSVGELGDLLESGFRGAEANLVESMIAELDRIETDTDTIQVELRSKLFPLERDLPPVDVMFMYIAIEWVGDLADLCHGVGNVLQLLLAR